MRACHCTLARQVAAACAVAAAQPSASPWRQHGCGQPCLEAGQVLKRDAAECMHPPKGAPAIGGVLVYMLLCPAHHEIYGSAIYGSSMMRRWRWKHPQQSTSIAVDNCETVHPEKSWQPLHCDAPTHVKPLGQSICTAERHPHTPQQLLNVQARAEYLSSILAYATHGRRPSTT